MASLGDLLCFELATDHDNNDRDDVEVLQATLRSLERLPPPTDSRLAVAGPGVVGVGIDNSLIMSTVPWCRRQVVCRTLNGDNDCRVLNNLLAIDSKCRNDGPPTDYFQSGVQPDILPYMRDMVTGWMLEVCEVERCADEVFPLAVSYLDRFLAAPAAVASRPQRDCAPLRLPPLRRSQLQLVAATCMFLASKYRDTMAIPATQLVMYTDFSVTLDQLMECELLVLQAIDWELSLPTPQDYFDHLLRRLPLTSQQRISIRRHAHTFAAMCITDTTFLCCPTSTMAAACVGAALSGLMGRCWCSDAEAGGVLARLQEMTSVDAACIKSWQNKIELLLNNYRVGSSSPGGAAELPQPVSQTTGTSNDDRDDCSGTKQTLTDDGQNEAAKHGCFQRQLSTPADVRDICLTE